MCSCVAPSTRVQRSAPSAPTPWIGWLTRGACRPCSVWLTIRFPASAGLRCMHSPATTASQRPCPAAPASYRCWPQKQPPTPAPVSAAAPPTPSAWLAPIVRPDRRATQLPEEPDAAEGQGLDQQQAGTGAGPIGDEAQQHRGDAEQHVAAQGTDRAQGGALRVAEFPL